MASPVARMAAGIGVAIAVATLATVPTIGGISTWKVVLGLAGLGLFIAAGRDRRR